VESPASLLAFVHKSDKLRAWAVRHETSGLKLGTRLLGERSKGGLPSEKVLVGMGGFIGDDGQEHWGIEIVDATPDTTASVATPTDATVTGHGVSTDGNVADATFLERPALETP
jgi:hypothetical protein